MSSAVHQNSSVSSPPPIPPFAGLPPVQAQVAAALAEGATVSTAARRAGLHRTTIHHWMRTLPEFSRSVQQARGDYKNQLADELAELAAVALSTLRTLLDDPNTPASVRLRAALAVLERPHFPNRGWTLPAQVESPERQRLSEDMALLAADYKMMRMTEALEKANPPEAEEDEEITAESGRSEAVSSKSTHAVTGTPRNAPCPCGSRLKYKRCCGRNAAPATNAASC